MPFGVYTGDLCSDWSTDSPNAFFTYPSSQPRCVAAQIVVILQRINYRSLAETSRHHARLEQPHKHTDNTLKSTVGNNSWCSLKFTFEH